MKAALALLMDNDYGALLPEVGHAELRIRVTTFTTTDSHERSHMQGTSMRVCLTLKCAHAWPDAENSVFALTGRLQERCDSISACEALVESTAVEHGRSGECIVQLALHAFGEKIIVTGRSSTASDAPLARALQSAYREAVDALRSATRKYRAQTDPGSPIALSSSAVVA